MCNNVNDCQWYCVKDTWRSYICATMIMKDCERSPPEGNTEGSAVFCGKAQPTWGRNRCWFYLEIIKTEKGENKHSVEETEGRQQNIIGIILCQKSPAENLRNHFAAKSIWQTQTFPEGSLHCIGSKVLVLSSLLVLAHFFEIYILFLSGLINKNSQIFMQYSVAAYVHCICLAFHINSMWGNCNKKRTS